jgi:chromosome segregation ATPase
LASDAEEIRREFDITRQELDEMAEEIASAEERMAGLAREDLQVSGLRVRLDEARRRHAALDERERSLRAKFKAVIGIAGETVH